MDGTEEANKQRQAFYGVAERHETEYEGKRQNINSLDHFGICATCGRFAYAETEFKVIFARCWEYETRLDSREPVKNCTGYEKKGGLSLTQMVGMAVFIDQPKRRVGFSKE